MMLDELKSQKKISFPDFIDLIKILFKVSTENLSLKYVDSENDECSVTGELELREAFVAKKSHEILRIQISFSQQILKKVKPPSIVLLGGGGLEVCPSQQQQLPCMQRKCWPERINQKKIVIQGLNDQALLLMEEKNYEEAKLLFQNQVQIFRCPWKKSVPLYNIACCEALLGNIDAALATLTQAINSGYRDIQHMEQDPDLNSLRGLEAFDALLTELRNKPERKCRWKQHLAKKQEISCRVNKTPEIEVKNPVSIVTPVEIPMQENSEKVSPIVVENVQQEPKIPTTEVKIEPPEAVFSESLVNHKIEDNIQIQSSPTNDNEMYRNELASLNQMGFTNTNENLNMLKIAGGNLSQAVQLLLQQ